MAGLAGGVTGAAIAAIVMIFEMTLNYNVMLPMLITVTVSYGVRKMLSPESIYTMKLTRRKHFVIEVLQRDLQNIKRAAEIMESHLTTVGDDLTVGEFLEELPKRPFATHFLAVSDGLVAGIVGRDKVFETAPVDATRKIAAIAEKNFAVVTEGFSFLSTLERLKKKRASLALVVGKEGDNSASNVKGIITSEQIGKARIESLDLLSD
jgi:CIC family chloride channel protein